MYTFAVQRLQIWPGDVHLWKGTYDSAQEFGVVDWDGAPEGLAQKVIEDFIPQIDLYGIARESFRAVVRPGDWTGADLDGEHGACAVFRGQVSASISAGRHSRNERMQLACRREPGTARRGDERGALVINHVGGLAPAPTKVAQPHLAGAV